MKTIRDFFINSSLLGCAFLLALLLGSCKSPGGGAGNADFGEDKARVASGKPSLYKGLAFSVMIPPDVRTNRKQTQKEIVHYFFTQEQARRKVGMGIYEGLEAESMVRNRKDLISEGSNPFNIDRFIGSVQAGVTLKGKRWREYFLFPKDNSNFAIQIWYFDVDPEDEEVFQQIIQSLKAIYKQRE